MTDKKRLDLILKDKFGFSRQYTKQIITEEKVCVNGKIITKSSFAACDSDIIEIKEDVKPKYVGRGGLKLEKAIELFNINLNDLTCIDIGSSTGGFTDCMLQNGASIVYAIDVGTDQLVQSLKDNSKVVSMEKTDIRNVSLDDVSNGADFIGTDVSFISLKKIAESIFRLLKPNGTCVVLVKPQFEAGKENLTKSGIVKNPKLHKKVLNDIINFFNENHLYVKDFTYSPITGGEGNIEYLLYCAKNENNEPISVNISNKIDTTIETAFNTLKGR